MAQKNVNFFYSNGHLVHLEPLFATIFVTISMSVGMQKNNSIANDVMHVCGSIIFLIKNIVKHLRNLILNSIY
jgi:hypothetical protein